MSLWLSVLSLSTASSSSRRGWGEEIGVNFVRIISDHLCGSGPIDWHHDWAGRWKRLLLLFLHCRDSRQPLEKPV